MTQYDLLDESGQVTYRGTLQVEPRFLKGYVSLTLYRVTRMPADTIGVQNPP